MRNVKAATPPDVRDAFVRARPHVPGAAARNTRRIAQRLPFGVLCLAACSASPAQDLAGSFFPAWMLCAALGVAATVAAHILLVAIRLDKHVLMPPLAYLSIAAAVTLFTWLSWFGQ